MILSGVNGMRHVPGSASRRASPSGSSDCSGISVQSPSGTKDHSWRTHLPEACQSCSEFQTESIQLLLIFLCWIEQGVEATHQGSGICRAKNGRDAPIGLPGWPKHACKSPPTSIGADLMLRKCKCGRGCTTRDDVGHIAL